jgi:trehalose/maltose hydrolase-like predicted phosphorylase
VDNPAFTIASASKFLSLTNDLRVEFGQARNDTWDTEAQMIAFPRSPSNITLEYQTMNNSVEVKQADVVLMTYPLDFIQNYTAVDKLSDLDYVSLARPSWE